MGHFSKKKYLKLARGFYGNAKNCPRAMIPKVHKSLQYAYIGRKLKKRTLRREWIQTINTGVREHNIMYSRFVYGLNNSNIKLDRKILAGLVLNEPYSFKAIVDEVKIQGKLDEIQNPNKITLLEAYAKGLLIDTPLKREDSDIQIRKQLEQDTKPFFYGERASVQQQVQDGLQKQAQTAKTLEQIKQ